MKFGPTEALSLIEARTLLADALPKDYSDYHTGRVFANLGALYPEVRVKISRDGHGPVLFLMGETEKLREIFKIASSKLLVSGCVWAENAELKLWWM